jgi:two-component system sensor histidine kinase BaeS
VYLLPGRGARGTAARVDKLRADVRRTVWVSVTVASAVAAALALLLAGPLVAQVTRLAAAAARVRAGDLSARVRTGSSDELGRTEDAFNEMAAALEHAEAHKRNLVHDVAHELRTPLTNVVGMLEAIEDGLRRPDAATIAALRAEAGLLTALVNDLQELSLAESGQLSFELTVVDVAAEAAAAVDGMREAADGVALEGPETAAAFATADPVRLRQVLRNLLRNALTATPAGGRVRVTVERRPGEVGLVVADTGRGIPAAHVPLVWERFHRVDPSRDRAAGGRGLGLAIVRQFIERMGGRVALTSVENEGATLEVWLREAHPPAERESG